MNRLISLLLIFTVASLVASEGEDTLENGVDEIEGTAEGDQVQETWEQIEAQLFEHPSDILEPAETRERLLKLVELKGEWPREYRELIEACEPNERKCRRDNFSQLQTLINRKRDHPQLAKTIVPYLVHCRGLQFAHCIRPSALAVEKIAKELPNDGGEGMDLISRYIGETGYKFEEIPEQIPEDRLVEALHIFMENKLGSMNQFITITPKGKEKLRARYDELIIGTCSKVKVAIRQLMRHVSSLAPGEDPSRHLDAATLKWIKHSKICTDILRESSESIVKQLYELTKIRRDSNHKCHRFMCS